MEFIELTHNAGIATVTLNRGKVNAIHEPMALELQALFTTLVDDADTQAVILTGRDKFFSFGFDVPHFYDHSPEDFARFLRTFCALSSQMFLFPKPMVAAVNGHCTAGGCILALTCDYRVMVDERAKIGLNEITFGSSIFAGSVAMLSHTVGAANAENVLLTGQLFSSSEACQLGLVDETTAAAQVLPRAVAIAEDRAKFSTPAYGSLKRLVRQPVVDELLKREEDSIREFVEIWYSPATREMTKGIQIRS